MAIINFNITFDTEEHKLIFTDIETNVSKSFSFAPSSAKNNSDVEESSEPTLTLLKNKYTLNKAAMSLMHLQPGDKISIAFDKDGQPVIGKDEALGVQSGNKLSGINSVICKGKIRETLLEFGTVFQIEPKDNGVFYLISEMKNKKEPISLDENLQVPAKGGISNIPDFNIDDLLSEVELDNEANYTMTGLDFTF